MVTRHFLITCIDWSIFPLHSAVLNYHQVQSDFIFSRDGELTASREKTTPVFKKSFFILCELPIPLTPPCGS